MFWVLKSTPQQMLWLRNKKINSLLHTLSEVLLWYIIYTTLLCKSKFKLFCAAFEELHQTNFDLDIH